MNFNADPPHTEYASVRHSAAQIPESWRSVAHKTGLKVETQERLDT
jgi:hypothetical protein